MTADQILREWAEEKFDRKDIARIELKDEFDGGWSEYTPGEGWYVEIKLYNADGECVKTDFFYDHTKMIREVAEFAAKILDREVTRRHEPAA